MQDNDVVYLTSTSNLQEAHLLRKEVGPLGPHLDVLAGRGGEHMAAAGRRALDRGDLPAAMSLLRRATDLLPEKHSAHLGVLADLNDCLFRAGATDAASVLLDDVIQRARLAGDEGLAARAELDRLWLMFMTHPLESTLEDLSQAVQAAVGRFEERGDDRNLASALEYLSTVQWFTGNAAAMLQQSERALSLARRVGDRFGSWSLRVACGGRTRSAATHLTT